MVLIPSKYFASITSKLVTTIVAIGVMGTKLKITTVITSITTVVVTGVPQLSAIPVVLVKGRFNII